MLEIQPEQITLCRLIGFANIANISKVRELNFFIIQLNAPFANKRRLQLPDRGFKVS